MDFRVTCKHSRQVYEIDNVTNKSDMQLKGIELQSGFVGCLLNIICVAVWFVS